MSVRLSFQNSLSSVALVATIMGSACGLVDNLNKPDDLSIRRFTASSTEIDAGAPVILSWDVDGAEAIQIDNGVGNVVAKGTRELRLEGSTAFVLTAHKGTSAATATIQVTVRGSGPAPVPSPSPSIAPLPSPSPSIAPAPSPSPTQSPAPGIVPVAKTCGAAAANMVRGCSVSVAYPSRLAEGQCLTINSVEVGAACPADANTTRALAVTLTAHTDAGQLNWRRSALSTNLSLPDKGALLGDGATRLSFNELVLDESTVIEIVRGSQVLAQVTIKSR